MSATILKWVRVFNCFESVRNWLEAWLKARLDWTITRLSSLSTQKLRLQRKLLFIWNVDRRWPNYCIRNIVWNRINLNIWLPIEHQVVHIRPWCHAPIVVVLDFLYCFNLTIDDTQSLWQPILELALVYVPIERVEILHRQEVYLSM